MFFLQVRRLGGFPNLRGLIYASSGWLGARWSVMASVCAMCVSHPPTGQFGLVLVVAEIQE